MRTFPGMNAFDATLLRAVNQLSRESWAFDVLVTELASSNLVKGVPLVALLLGFWFSRERTRERREIVLATLAAGAAALFAGRLLASGLPHRERPIHAPDLEFLPPFGQAEHAMRGWSAFPSDHAMLFVALATGILFLAPRLGALALAYVLAVVTLPRVYLGWHHPTDVLAGAALGAGMAVLANRPAVRRAIVAVPLRWHDRHPASYYAVAFLVCAQLATMFGDVRAARRAVARAAAGPPAAEADLAAPSPGMERPDAAEPGAATLAPEPARGQGRRGAAADGARPRPAVVR